MEALQPTEALHATEALETAAGVVTLDSLLDAMETGFAAIAARFLSLEATVGGQNQRLTLLDGLVKQHIERLGTIPLGLTRAVSVYVLLNAILYLY